MGEVAGQAREDIGQLTAAAVAGDEQAWAVLVRRFDRRLRAAARGYRLCPADTDEVVQSTWLRACLSLAQVRDHAAVGAWLEVTLRREALRLVQRGVHEVASERPEDLVAHAAEDPDDSLIEAQCHNDVRAAVRRLSGRQQAVMSCLLANPAPSYEQVASTLGVPIGSIGPTRNRALGRLRRDRELHDRLRP